MIFILTLNLYTGNIKKVKINFDLINTTEHTYTEVFYTDL